MCEAYVINGILTDERTVALDEAIPVTSGRVRVVVEPIVVSKEPRSYREVMESIRHRQNLRGHKPPTRESVDSFLRSERESWGE